MGARVGSLVSGPRAVFTDQLLSAVSNAAVWLLATNQLDRPEFARFTLLMSGAQLIVGLCRSILGEPLAVSLTTSETIAINWARFGRMTSILLGFSIAVTLPLRLFGGAGFLPLVTVVVVVLQDFLRYASFRIGRADLAMASDFVWIVSLIALHAAMKSSGRSGIQFFLLWSLSGAIGLLVLALSLLRSSPRTATDVPLRVSNSLRTHFAFAYLLSACSGLVLLFILAASSGRDAAAAYRSALTVASVGTMIGYAIQTALVAEFGKAFARGAIRFRTATIAFPWLATAGVTATVLVFRFPLLTLTKRVLGPNAELGVPLLLNVGLASALGTGLLTLLALLRSIEQSREALRLAALTAVLSVAVALANRPSAGARGLANSLALVNGVVLMIGLLVALSVEKTMTGVGASRPASTRSRLQPTEALMPEVATRSGSDAFVEHGAARIRSAETPLDDTDLGTT